MGNFQVSSVKPLQSRVTLVADLFVQDTSQWDTRLSNNKLFTRELRLIKY
jgi:hypothetical protein